MGGAQVFVKPAAPFCPAREPRANKNASARDSVSGRRLRSFRVTTHDAKPARQSACASPPVVLTVAGSDSGGGAGIQADLKTFAACGVFGCSAISALTAQNTHGVSGIFSVPEDFLRKQLDAVLDDLPVTVVKTGVLPDVQVSSFYQGLVHSSKFCFGMCLRSSS